MLPSQRDDWGTPKKLFDELNKEFHFDLDAAASDSNHKCDRYFTVEDNGLMQSWGGILCLLIHPTADVCMTGVRKLMQKETEQRL